MDDAASNLRLPDSGAGHTANVLQNAGLVVSCTSTKTGKPMGSTRSWWSANIACSFRIMLKLVHLHVCRCISMMIHELRIANCQDSRLCLNQYRPISCGFVWSKFQDDPSFFFSRVCLDFVGFTTMLSDQSMWFCFVIFLFRFKSEWSRIPVGETAAFVTSSTTYSKPFPSLPH